MTISSKHPQYDLFLPDWVKMNHTYAGQRAIKEATTAYLPATSGMIADGMAAGQGGRDAYNAYLIRASFPDVVRGAVSGLLGVLHHKPASIELPPVMEPMLENATSKNESLQMLLRRINENQLRTGRLGLLLDVVANQPANVLPYISLYGAIAIINWDDGTMEQKQMLDMVVLDETEMVRGKNTEAFTWQEVEKYRLLQLGTEANNNAGVYTTATFSNASDTVPSTEPVSPSIAGNTLKQIPFVFINANDIVADPDIPPLLGLADMSLTIYRGEADYRQALFMQGQDTLVVTGDNDQEATYRTGANASITLPLGGTAEFIGVDSTGLSEMRESLQNDKSTVASKGGELLDSVSRSKESGDALQIRVSARTASLNQLALAGAFGLEKTLKNAAVWVGADPDKVVVTPNLDFVDESLDGSTLVDFMTAKTLGAPLSNRSIHDMLVERDVTSMTYDEELEEIEKEESEDIGNDGPGPVEDEDPELEE